jgi:hypothetical protein
MRISNMTNPDMTVTLRNAADPIERLMWYYENPAAEVISSAASNMPVAGITSNMAPWELIQAAGAFPCVINSGNANHTDISSFMEECVFEERIRAIFGAAISGELQYLSLMLISRTSEQEYKLFLYLREVARQHPARRIPPIYLYDMLHTRSPESYSYGRAPWGGLPKPALLCARLTCDCIQRVFAIWAEAFDAECAFLDNPGATELPPRWWELSRYRWREPFEEHRLKFTVGQLQNLIKALQRVTEKQFRIDRLRNLMAILR